MNVHSVVVSRSLAFALLCLAPWALAAPGDLDPTFGTAGIVTDSSLPPPLITALVRQPDGKLVAATDPQTFPGNFKLTRYNENGLLDASFGTGGIVTGPVAEDAQQLVLQADGRLVVAAQSLLLRYLPDGTLDSSFGGAGSVSIGTIGTESGDVGALVLQPDGKLIVLGDGAFGQGTVLVRFNSDGTLDRTFGIGGIVQPPTFVAVTASPKAAWLQPDGRLLVGAVDVRTSNRYYAVVRYEANGSLDTSYGEGGILPLGQVPQFGGAVTDIAPLPDGRVAVAATYNEVGGSAGAISKRVDFVLFAVRPDGSLDTSFGHGGRVDTAIGGFLVFHMIDPWLGTTNALAVQSDGKVVQAGMAAGGSVLFTFALARFHPDGSIDSSFGNAGIVTMPDGGFTNRALAMQPDGKLVLGGLNRLVRYLLIDSTSGDVAVEFYHAAFDHYFITSLSDEIATLDSGAIPGWRRTGQYFSVFPRSAPGAAPMCRFFSGPTFAPKSSHFYTPFAFECDIVQHNPNWLFEGDVMAVQLPDNQGNCASGDEPLYRLYNNGQGGAPNHRYTPSLTIRGDMLAAGWIPEGAGTIGVIACVPN